VATLSSKTCRHCGFECSVSLYLFLYLIFQTCKLICYLLLEMNWWFLLLMLGCRVGFKCCHGHGNGFQLGV
jgi:hypothetical protein